MKGKASKIFQHSSLVTLLSFILLSGPIPEVESAIDESTHNSNTNHPHEQFIYQYMEQPQPDRELDDGHRISSQPSISTSTSQDTSSSTTLKKSSSLISSDTSTNPYRTLKGFPYYIPQVQDSNNNEPEVTLGWRLVIKPVPSGSNARLIVKRIDESLNLTCTMEYVGVTNITRRLDDLTDLGDDQIFRLAWHLPIMPQNSKNRVSFIDFHNSKHLIVDHLKESDGGEYECTANAVVDSHQMGFIPPYVESIQILVKPKKGSCNEPLVLCSSGECIGKRYFCDGKFDCKSRSDESYETCGTYNPCDGKLRCADGRCIHPFLCCERTSTFDKNCTLVLSPCCAQIKHLILLDQHYGPQPLRPNNFHEMGFLQTTIYTVIGCSMAFMFIITIMVIAICRVHLRRSALSQMQLSHSQLRSRMGPGPFGELLFNSAGGGGGRGVQPGADMPYAVTNGLLVTYNINNGVQFMGRPMNPPPYSEQPSIPPREGPPPPYCSVENLTTTTLEGGGGVGGLPSYSSNPSGDSNQATSSRNIINSDSNSHPNEPNNLNPHTAENNGANLRHENGQDRTEIEDETLEVAQPLLQSSQRVGNSQN